MKSLSLQVQTKSLNTLDISCNPISNEGFFVLKEGLLKNKSLCRLSLRATRLSDEGLCDCHYVISASTLLSITVYPVVAVLVLAHTCQVHADMCSQVLSH